MDDIRTPLLLRPTVMDVSLDALEANYLALKKFVSPAKVMAVLKANAYGHGLVACGKHLERIGADSFGVGLVEEGVALRRAGVQLPILILGGICGEQIQHFLEYDLDITASSVSKLQAIEETAKKFGKRASVQLKIDTGMERLGVHYYTAETLFEKALSCKHCDVRGVYSHFAAAESEDLSFTVLQLERFQEAFSKYEREFSGPLLRHIANSAAVLQLPASYLDMVRVGISLYGVEPAAHLKTRLPLKPVMSLRSQVVYFKVVKKGATVSYGQTWKAPEDSRVVTIPIGYGDGFSRCFSNIGAVLIRGKRYPIIGAICMDQMMVNIGNDEAYNGDEVMLIGSQGGESITANELAVLANTIPYEILTSTNLRVPRRYFLGGEEIRE